ncbi:MAG TPA: nuclear transport factor 2 family protein [Blastocatellia bacterium]|nr:nuclear transport factor 2 family protein [Blastocatellia bacterium]
MIEHIDSQFFDNLHAAFRDGDANIAGKLEEAENVSRVEKIFSTIARHDFEALGEVLADDVVLDVIASADNPMAGQTRGLQQVTEATRKNFALLEDQKPIIESVVAQGDSVVVVARERGRIAATGRSYDIRWVQVYKFREGKLISIREWADSEAFREAAGPSGLA